MPFFKFDKKPQGTFIRIVESYRPNKNSTPRHRTLLTLGKVKVEDIYIQKFYSFLARICQIRKIPLPAEHARTDTPYGLNIFAKSEKSPSLQNCKPLPFTMSKKPHDSNMASSLSFANSFKPKLFYF